MNNSSLKKRLLSVAMAAVMVFSLLPATAWAAMAENLPAASGQTRTEQKRGGSDTYTVTPGRQKRRGGADRRGEEGHLP